MNLIKQLIIQIYGSRLYIKYFVIVTFFKCKTYNLFTTLSKNNDNEKIIYVLIISTYYKKIHNLRIADIEIIIE